MFIINETTSFLYFYIDWNGGSINMLRFAGIMGHSLLWDLDTIALKIGHSMYTQRIGNSFCDVFPIGFRNLSSPSTSSHQRCWYVWGTLFCQKLYRKLWHLLKCTYQYSLSIVFVIVYLLNMFILDCVVKYIMEFQGYPSIQMLLIEALIIWTI